MLVISAFLFITGQSAAITAGHGHDDNRETSALSFNPPSSVRSLQLKYNTTGFGLLDQNEETLDPGQLLGKYSVTPQMILNAESPHLSELKLKLYKIKNTGNSTVHETYHLYYGNFRIVNAQIRIHTYNNRLVFYRSQLPDFYLNSRAPELEDFIPLEDLGYTEHLDQKSKVEAIIIESAGFPSPSWLVETNDPETGELKKTIYDAQTGAILEEQSINFNIANVYAINSQAGFLETVNLPDLLGDGYLESPYLSVFAPQKDDPRVFSENNIFQFNPDSASESLYFDQVQAYYNAARVLDWFTSNYNYQLEQKITIQVNDRIAGRGDNAFYVPPPLGPAIRLGQGQGKMHNLARDSDVLAHEFAHHIIFEFITSTDGASGELHEGLSDYFAYAINEDPYLAETILEGAPYLRTAKISEEFKKQVRFDDPTKPQTRYFRAQIWSSFLWQLREEIGSTFDGIVYNSLNYLGSHAGYRDAILAILNADRDLNPLALQNSENQIYGSNKCKILNAASAHGYAVYTEELDGGSCGLDLQTLGQESRDYKASFEPEEQDTRPIIPGCGNVFHHSKNPLSSTFLWILMLTPFALVFRSKFYGH